MKVTVGRNLPLTDVEKSWIHRFIGDGYSIGVTARVLGRSERTVQDFVHLEQLPVLHRWANQTTARVVPDDLVARAGVEAAESRRLAMLKVPESRPADRVVWRWMTSSTGGYLVPITLPKISGIVPPAAVGLQSIGGRMRSAGEGAA